MNKKHNFMFLQAQVKKLNMTRQNFTDVELADMMVEKPFTRWETEAMRWSSIFFDAFTIYSSIKMFKKLSVSTNLVSSSACLKLVAFSNLESYRSVTVIIDRSHQRSIRVIDRSQMDLSFEF